MSKEMERDSTIFVFTRSPKGLLYLYTQAGFDSTSESRAELFTAAISQKKRLLEEALITLENGTKKNNHRKELCFKM